MRRTVRVSFTCAAAVCLVAAMVGQGSAQPSNSAPSRASAGLALGKNPKVHVGVTFVSCDDIPSVLKSLKIPFQMTATSQNPLRDFNVIFVGCGAQQIGNASGDRVSEYVKRGGVLYVSDLSCTVLEQAFPADFGTFTRNGGVATIQCDVVDKQLQERLGKKIPLNFDMGAWAYPQKLGKRVDVLVTAPHAGRPGGPPQSLPVVLTMTHGHGKVVFTSFHNHANTNELERKLIEYLVSVPVAAAGDIQGELLAGLGNLDELKEKYKGRPGGAGAGAGAGLPWAAAGGPGTDLAKLRGNPVALLEALENTEDTGLRRKIAAELARTSPKYAEVKDQLAQIQQFVGSDDAKTSAAARSQLANAFQRAPISHCLYWIGQGDDDLDGLVWKQLDGRIARADAKRRRGYAQTAVAVLGHQEFGTAARSAAIDLLARLDDREAAGSVIEGMLELPRDLWPKAGTLLRDLTGQDFGPREGDGIGEVLEAKKQWEAWWREQGSE